MIKIFKNLFKSPFVKSVTVMAAGSAGAQVITILLSPIITRLYGPEAFGIMGTFTSIMNIVVPIAALSYPIAIVLPKRNKEAKNLIKLSIYIATFISLLSLIILAVFNKDIINIFNIEELSNYLYLLPLIIISTAFMQVSEQWLIRNKEFLINARVTLYQSLLINSSKTGFGFIHPSSSILVIHTALTNGLRAFLMILYIKPSIKRNTLSKKEQMKSIIKVGKKYADFPLFRAPETFINAVSQGLPVLMLTLFFGPASAGFYTLGRTTLSIPGRLIGKSVGDVFYPRITEAAYNKENITQIIKKATFALAGIGIIPFGLIILFGPYLFSFIFGEEWVIAGEYARWIGLWTYFGFMNRPSVRSLPVLNAQKFHLFYTVLMLFTRVGALAIGYFAFSSDLVAVALFGISGAILNIGLIVIALFISKKKHNLYR